MEAIERLRGLKTWAAENLDQDDASSMIHDLDKVILVVEKTGKERQSFGNVLAVIHRDGGHYIQKHGVDKACKDAISKISDDKIASEKMNRQVDAWDKEKSELQASLVHLQQQLATAVKDRIFWHGRMKETDRYLGDAQADLATKTKALERAFVRVECDVCGTKGEVIPSTDLVCTLCYQKLQKNYANMSKAFYEKCLKYYRMLFAMTGERLLMVMKDAYHEFSGAYKKSEDELGKVYPRSEFKEVLDFVEFKVKEYLGFVVPCKKCKETGMVREEHRGEHDNELVELFCDCEVGVKMLKEWEDSHPDRE